jgi:PAS domain S-box-containing protein
LHAPKTTTRPGTRKHPVTPANVAARPTRPAPAPTRSRRKAAAWVPDTGFLDCCADWIAVVDADRRIRYANRSWREGLGYAAAGPVPLRLDDVVSPEELARWQARLAGLDLPADGQPTRLTWRTRAGRSVTLDGHVHVHPAGGTGQPRMFACVCPPPPRDEARPHRESEAVLQVVELHAPVGIFETDPQGRLVRANARWRQIASLEHLSEPRGAWWQMVGPEDRDRVGAEWQSALKHGHEFRSQFRVNTGQNLERFAYTCISRLHGADGSLRGFVGVSEDITEQLRFKRQQEEAKAELEQRVGQRTSQLELANRELAQFAHVVAHDLKAPLRAIHNLAEWLGRDYLDRLESEGQRLLTLMQQRVQHMHSLIEGVLAYTRLGQMEEAEAEVDVHRLITGILAILAPPPHITIRLPLLLPCVRGGAERLRHVLQNLLENAIKFMDKPQGLVTLTATRLDGAWEFAVADNGPGIAPRYHALVFEMFEQLPGSRQTGGTGIGLALVKRIVESRGGQVQLQSREGAGALFSFTWPDQPKPRPGVDPGGEPMI